MSKVFSYIAMLIAQFVLCCALNNVIGASSIIAHLSSEEIIKTHNFKYAKLNLSGKINKQGDVIIEVYGPLATYRLWKKEKKFGFWVNSSNVIIPSVYSYHFIASSNIDNPKTVRLLSSIKDNFAQYLRNLIIHNTDQLDPVTTQLAFQKIQHQSGFFAQKISKVIMNNNKFKSAIYLPANAMSGKYTVKVYFAQNGKIREIKYLTFSVHQDTLYSELDNLVSQKPLLYACVAIFLSVLISLLVGLLFKNF